MDKLRIKVIKGIIKMRADLGKPLSEQGEDYLCTLDSQKLLDLYQWGHTATLLSLPTSLLEKFKLEIDELLTSIKQ